MEKEEGEGTGGSGSSLKNGQLVGIIFHTPRGFYCQEQSVGFLTKLK